ncbi:MAG: hypothetical protein ACR2LK_02075, partial [Solirubrobacteraceae bacterium]
SIPAILAGVDGIVNKAAPANELYDAIRRVARGERLLPPITRELLDAAGAALDPADLPILGMSLDDTPVADMASALGLDPAEVSRRLDRMISRLKVEVASPRE